MRQGLKFKYLRERELHTYIYLDYVRVEFLFKKRRRRRNGKTSKISRDPLTYFVLKHKPM